MKNTKVKNVNFNFEDNHDSGRLFEFKNAENLELENVNVYNN